MHMTSQSTKLFPYHFTTTKKQMMKMKGIRINCLMVTCTKCYIFKYNTFYYRFFAIRYDIILLFLFTALTLPGMMRIGVLKISSPSFDLSLRGAGIRSSSTL